MPLSSLDRALVARVERAVGTFFAPRLAGVSNTRWDAWFEGRGTMSSEDRSWLGRLEAGARRGDLPQGVKESLADKPLYLSRRTGEEWLDLRARGRDVTRRDARAWRKFVLKDLDLDPDDPELSDT